MENIKGSFIKPFDKNHPGDTTFVIRVDQQTKETLKAVFMKLMNQLTSSVNNEQVFCQEFFYASAPKINKENLNESSSDLKQLNKTPSTASSLSSMRQMNTSSTTVSENKIDL